MFISGQAPAGQGFVARINGATVPVQMDVKTTHPDGSAKMVVLTLPRPDLAPGASLAVDLVPSAAPAQPALDLRAGLAAHDVTVTLTSAGGRAIHVDVLDALRDALADGSASFWQKGPLATQARVEVPLEGSQRLVFDVTAFKGGGLEVEAQFNNDGAMETDGGRIAYGVSVKMDGQVVARHSIDQALYQNWHETFSSNGRDGGQGLGDPSSGWLNIRQDIDRFQDAGAVADYNLSGGVSQDALNKWFQATQAAGWEAPLSNNNIMMYMPQTGGREDIGFTTASNSAWLVSQDARAAAYAMGQAEAAGAVPWNMWDAKSGTWLGTDAYPKLWTDPRGGTGVAGNPDSRGLTQQSDGDGWSPDRAHQPDLSYVPYLMTGERWMLDNLQAQASWNIMNAWPDMRGGAADLVVVNNQVRASAWALRQVDHAAWASPDGSPEQAAFQEASNANWAWLVKQIPAWTQIQGEAHGYMMGVYGTKGALPPWQQDMFASTVIAAAARGNADAMTFLKWQSNFLVGRFQQDDNGFAAHDGAAYLIAISNPVTGAPYKSWAEIGAKTQALGYSNGEGWDHSQGYYGPLALATLAGIAKLTGSAEATKAYWDLLADAPPFTDGAAFAKDPTYWIAPPETGAPHPPPVVNPPPPVVVHPPPPVVVEPPPPPEPAMRDLSMVLSGDAWKGNPEASIKVNGVEVFRGAITASRHEKMTIDLGDVPLHENSVVTVRYLNELKGSGADEDRNLYVRDVLVDGVSTGNFANMYSAGEKTFKLAGVATPPPPPPPPPPPAPEPAMRDLSVVLSGDAWKGNPEALISVNGVEAFRGAITASRHEKMTIDLGDVPLHADAVVTVRYLNEMKGSGTGEDRNLYVRDVLVDGVSSGNFANMYSAGEKAFKLAGVPIMNGDAPFDFGTLPAQPVPQGPPATVMLGEGEDVLRIGLSADAWSGKVRYAVLVDGEQLGGVQRIKAAHAKGQMDYLDIHGDFDPGQHEVAIRYLNDAWGVTANQDRNLYVGSVALNGEDLGMSASLLTNGDALFQF